MLAGKSVLLVEKKMQNEFPYKIKHVDPNINEELLKDFSGEKTGFVQVGPEKWFFPIKYEKEAEKLYNFQPKSTDIWVVSFPRSGTTWTQEMAWLIANDLDYETSQKIPLVERFPFLEFHVFVHDELKKTFLKENSGDIMKQNCVEHISRPCYEFMEEMTSPRFIKTHLPFSLLSPNLLTSGCKVIYVARNPKDVAVSFYHLNKLFRTQGYNGDFIKYWNYFENGLQAWSPYWSHVKEGWDRRHHPNVLFLFYEDMKKNLPNTLSRVANFLGKTLSDKQMEKLITYLDFRNFKNNSAVNMDTLKDIRILNTEEQSFIRNGKIGGWKEEFTPELNERADRWIEENLKNSDLKFPYMP